MIKYAIAFELNKIHISIWQFWVKYGTASEKVHGNLREEEKGTEITGS